ncbi:MAG: arsenate reductase family protein, partial [Peptococcaceae bacterium]|nr:arsenate reductase family protein [Peptococcaceae bacterium]
RWIGDSGQPVKKFFNTSGLKYKELGLKDKLPTMSDEEQIALLATDGMLVKRPLLIGDGVVLAGFKAEKWAEALQK